MNANQGINRDKGPRSSSLIVVPTLLCVLSTWLAWAGPEAPDIRELAPDAAIHPDQQQLETIIRQKYPQLVTQKLAGVPVVTVLLNHDGTLAATDLEISANDPGKLTASRAQFARFGPKARDLSYIGVAHLRLPLNTVLVMFGGRSASGGS
jgi:hypothetical protein